MNGSGIHVGNFKSLVTRVHKKTAVHACLDNVKANHLMYKERAGYLSPFFVQQGNYSFLGWNVTHLSDRAFVADIWVTLKRATWGGWFFYLRRHGRESHGHDGRSESPNC